MAYNSTLENKYGYTELRKIYEAALMKVQKRMVVDLGFHYKGWSRAHAIEYMERNTTLSKHKVITEIDRYIG